MLSVLPVERREPGDPPAALEFDEAALLNVPDLWLRSKLADEVVAQLAAAAAVVRKIRAEAVRELVHNHGAKQQQVASHLKKSRQRIHQMMSGRQSSGDRVRAVA
ncbi:hypothetical protein ACQEVZ_60585 [Dactylosporangium sp. CA-152071]|uniref:hypothetical protein n=1 Tax=Dactylosporangium sp. CA-152071 TaxID=3239933 RepID=UPI003D92AF69